MSKPDTVWNYKPWWCQPWSIMLTGVSIIAGSWLLLKLVWLTVIVAIPISAWMIFFLLIYPQSIAQAESVDQKSS